jgi:hypothetical protein
MPTMGDETPDIIYTAVGAALSRWEAAEMKLASLFSVLLGIHSSTPALRAYGAVTTFQVRQQMVLAAADSFFHDNPDPDLQRRIHDLFKKLMNDASARRNEIAHGIVTNIHTSRKLPNYFLVPPYHSTRKRGHDAEPSYLYTASHISTYAMHFDTLSKIIFQVVRAVLGVQPPLR